MADDSAAKITSKLKFFLITLPKSVLWLGGIVVGLLLLLFIASFFVDKPLQRMVVERTNQALKGYRVQLAGLDLHPIGFSVTLRGLQIAQEAHPQPPIAVFPELDVSIHWRALLSGHLVSDWEFDRPRLYLNLQQLRHESEDNVPVEKKGWQKAVRQIYPLKINLLTVKDASFIYIDKDPQHPVQLSRIYVQVRNIRNILSPKRTYPSTIHVRATVFGAGQASIDGRANFLATPYPGVKVHFSLEKIPLHRLKPISGHANLAVTGGTLSGRGEAEYSPSFKSAHIEDLQIDGVRINYIHAPSTTPREKKHLAEVEKAAKKAKNKPGLLFLIDRLHLTGNTGMVNTASKPNYRVFLSDINLTLKNLSNHFRKGPASVRLTGEFMGSGKTLATADFRPVKSGADFDLNIKIEKTRLKAMNDLLRAYGNVDVAAGTFSVYSQVSVRGKKIKGYIKPLFKNLDVLSPKDRNKPIFQQIYEGVVGAISYVLENKPHKQVATQVNLSGTVKNPQTSTWQIIVNLIQNGFFKAILPGFERELKKSG